MANFRQHAAGGAAVGLAGAALGAWRVGLSPMQAADVFILGIVGGILPDVDSDSSRPVRILFSLLGAILPIAAYALWTRRPENPHSLEVLVFVLGTGFILIRYGVSFAFFRITRHRGACHTLPAALICGELVFLLFVNSALWTRLTFALTAAGGYLSHLALDEISSVDIENQRLRESAGTAVNLFERSWLANVVLYGLLFGLGALIANQERLLSAP